MLTLLLFVACDSNDPVVGDDTGTTTGKPSGTVPPLVINEFLAANLAAYEDPANPGDFDDWVEIYNTGGDLVELDGLYLSDDPENPTQFALPEGQGIEAEGYLLLWCDAQVEQGDRHTPFKLDKKSDFIGLYYVDGGNDPVRVDAVEYTDQAQDVSFGRVPDGSADWQPLEPPTPGVSNR